MFSTLLPILFATRASFPATGLSISVNPLHQLLSRQSFGGFDPGLIPSECRSQCGILVDTMNHCSGSMSMSDPAMCFCSHSAERGFVNCVNCMVARNSSQSSIDAEQVLIDRYVELCNSAGVPLPAMTISGGVSHATGVPKLSDNSSSSGGSNAALRNSCSVGATIVAAGLAVLALHRFC